jgi:Tol biopolymer transport system component
VAALLGALALAGPARATFPGKNGKIAFPGCGPTDCGIGLMNPDGSGATQITHNPYRYRSCVQDLGCFDLPAPDSYPIWSADGRKLLFSRWESDDASLRLVRTEIYTVSADGSGLTQLTRPPDVGFAYGWSPDAREIAFIHSNRPDDLYVMRADGTGSTRIATGEISTADWSPDGSTIAFAASLPGSRQSDIHLVNPDGSNDRVILTSQPGSVFENSAPFWSPDGGRIVLTRAGVPEPCCLSPSDVWVMNADGSGLQDLTPPPSGQFDDQYDTAFGWAPDGSKILFNTNGSWLRTMNPDGTGKSTVAFVGGGAWQPLPNRPPDCSSVTATPGSLWPPNGKLVSVSLSGATDPDGDLITLTITGVTQDEPTGQAPDAVLGPTSDEVKLRARRTGRGDGRVYRIAFKAADGQSGECTGNTTVGVPRKREPAVDSAPPSYNSLVASPRRRGHTGE